MLNRVIIVVGIIVTMVLWFGPYPVPSWAVVALGIVLFPMSIGISVKRIRTERRLLREFWKALKGR